LSPVDDEVTDGAAGASVVPVVEGGDAVDEASTVEQADARPGAHDGQAGTVDLIPAPERDGDLPVAVGAETDEADRPDTEDPENSEDPEELFDYGDEDDDLGVLSDDRVAGRRNALPRRLESWRSRSAGGAIATALAMGLQQVFEPEKRRPAAVAEAPSNPYSDSDPVTVDYVPDDAESTTVHVKPWLLAKDDPT